MSSKSFGEHTAKELSERMMKGEALRKICAEKHMPSFVTAKKWIQENKYNAFSNLENAKEKSKGGRPSIYTEEIVAEILNRVMCGESTRSICRDEHMPHFQTIQYWKAQNHNNFLSQYNIAFRARVENFAEEMLDIADNSTNDYMEKEIGEGKTVMVFNPENISRSNLRVNTRKTILSKLVDQYSDKQTIDHRSSDGSMTPTVIRRKLIDPKKD